MKRLLITASSKTLIISFLLISCLLSTSVYAADILPPDKLIIGVKSDSDYKTYYIRTDGGTFAQCTGLSNSAYLGSGTGLNCALNHPFELFPPGGAARISGGDTVIVGAGSYRMGHTIGLYDSGDCQSNWGYSCTASQIPSGIDAENPTRILGAGWDTQLGDKPELYGVERASQVLKIGDSDFVEIQWLELTDHEDCTYNSTGEAVSSRCNRSTYPRGDHADTGIIAGNSSHDVLLKNLNIHGFTIAGIKAAGLTDWTIENVRLANNSFVGWDGDYGDTPSNSGDLIFRNVEISFNGCSETYPGGEPHNCYSQSQGGYGDGLGTALTDGNWLFENVDFSHNVSDGLDLLYHSGNGTITIKNSRFEANAGNQLKVATDSHIENSIIVGNCEYFATTNPGLTIDSSIGFTSCRANGDTIAYIMNNVGQNITLVNNTILSRSTVMILAKGSVCNGTENFISRNNIFYGDRSYLKSLDVGTVRPTMFYNGGSDGNGAGPCGPAATDTAIQIDNKYSISYQTKNGDEDCRDPSALCDNPRFSALKFSDTGYWDLSLSPESPAVGKSGLTVGDRVFGSVVAPSTDYNGISRTSSTDWGALKH